MLVHESMGNGRTEARSTEPRRALVGRTLVRTRGLPAYVALVQTPNVHSRAGDSGDDLLRLIHAEPSTSPACTSSAPRVGQTAVAAYGVPVEAVDSAWGATSDGQARGPAGGDSVPAAGERPPCC